MSLILNKSLLRFFRTNIPMNICVYLGERHEHFNTVNYAQTRKSIYINDHAIAVFR